MKIPRYQIKGGNVQSGTSLRSNLAAGDGFQKIGQAITNSSKKLAQADINQTAAFRKLDINAKSGKAKGILTEVASRFLKNTDNMDQENPDSWNENYVGAMTSARDAVKKMYPDDEVVGMYIDADYLEINTAYGLKLDKKIKETKINNASFAFAKDTDSYYTDLSNSVTTSEVLAKYSTYKNRVLLPNKGILISDKNYKEQVVKADNNASLEIMRIEAGKNSKKLSLDGTSNNTDYAAMLKNLTNKNYKLRDVNGQEISVDHPLRQALIKETKENLDELLTSNKKIETSMSIQTTNSVHNKLINYNNTTDYNERIKIKSDIINDINNLPDEFGETKTALLTLVNKTVKGAPTKASANPKIYMYFSIKARQKAIDTPQEFKMVSRAFEEGLITREEYKEIFTIYESNLKGVDAREKEYKKNAYKFLKNEIGGIADIDDVFGEAGLNQNILINFAQSMAQAGKMTESELKAYQQLERLLDVGRKKNFSVEEMLLDETSPNYILNKIINYAKLEGYKEKNQVYPNLSGDFIFSGAPRINYDESGQMRKREPDESIEEYIQKEGF